MFDTKANDICENFVREESNELIQFYHEEAPHGSHYLHKSTCWNMRNLERLTKACKKSKCTFAIRNEHSVYVWDDDLNMYGVIIRSKKVRLNIPKILKPLFLTHI